MSLSLLETLLAARGPVALCTVMQVKGSAPRHAGSWMLADATGLVAGSVGGGKGEAKVLAACRDALADGKARVLEVEMQGTEAEGADMVCGGTSRVLVEPVASRAAFEAARELLFRGERAVLAHRYATGESAVLDGSGSWVPAAPEGVDPEAARHALAARDLLAKDGVAARVVCVPSTELFAARPAAERKAVIGDAPVKLAIEAGVRQGWDAIIGADGLFVGMSGFGMSGPYKEVYAACGITAQAAADQIRKALGRA